MGANIVRPQTCFCLYLLKSRTYTSVNTCKGSLKVVKQYRMIKKKCSDAPGISSEMVYTGLCTLSTTFNNTDVVIRGQGK